MIITSAKSVIQVIFYQSITLNALNQLLTVKLGINYFVKRYFRDQKAPYNCLECEQNYKLSGDS